MTIVNSDTFSGDIGDSNSETITLYTEKADRIHVMVDDGTTGGTPAEYSLTHYAEPPGGGINRDQFYQEETTRTARSYRFDSVGIRTSIEITNTSGASETFEITVIAHE